MEPSIESGGYGAVSARWEDKVGGSMEGEGAVAEVGGGEVVEGGEEVDGKEGWTRANP